MKKISFIKSMVVLMLVLIASSICVMAAEAKAVTIKVNCFSAAYKSGISGVNYTLYAADNIKDENGTIIIARDTQLKTSTTSPNGVAEFKLSLPAGRYYVTQTTGKEGYETQTFKIYYNVNDKEMLYENDVYLPLKSDSLELSVTAPAQAGAGEAYAITASALKNSSDKSVANLMYTQNIPYNTDLISVTTGVYSKNVPLIVYYTTNLTSDFKQLATTNTKTTKTINTSSLALADKEYITTVIFSFGNVEGDFSVITSPTLTVKTASGARYGASLYAEGNITGYVNGVQTKKDCRVSTTINSVTALYTSSSTRNTPVTVKEANSLITAQADKEGYTLTEGTGTIKTSGVASHEGIRTGDATITTPYIVLTALSAIILIITFISIIYLQLAKMGLLRTFESSLDYAE